MMSLIDSDSSAAQMSFSKSRESNIYQLKTVNTIVGKCLKHERPYVFDEKAGDNETR